MIDTHHHVAFERDEDRNSGFLEIVCPGCHTISRRIRIQDQLEQRTFDDFHRNCYINAVPNGRA